MKKNIINIAGVAVISICTAFACGGCGTILGAIIGYQSGELLAGAAIGAGVDYLASMNCEKKKDKPCDEVRNKLCGEKVTVEIENPNGSVSRVELIKKGGKYIGPKGEVYNELPSQEQLMPYYGMEAQY